MSYKFAINTVKVDNEIIVGWTYASDSHSAIGNINSDDLNEVLSSIESEIGYINDEIEQMVMV